MIRGMNSPFLSNHPLVRTYAVNCILTFERGPQVIRNLDVPLEGGEEVCRAFFAGFVQALDRSSDLDSRLRKVSMCADSDETPDFETRSGLAWFNRENGKLYWA